MNNKGDALEVRFLDKERSDDGFYCSYQEINEGTHAKLIDFFTTYRKLHDEGKIVLLCHCKANETILMQFNTTNKKRPEAGYLQSKSGGLDKHAKECKYKSKRDDNSKHIPGWDDKGNDQANITLDVNIMLPTKHSKPKTPSKTRNGDSFGDVKFSAFFKRFILNVWNKFILDRTHSVPPTERELFGALVNYSKGLSMHREPAINLNEILFKNILKVDFLDVVKDKEKRLKAKMVVFLPYVSWDETTGTLVLKNIINQNQVILRCSKELFDSANDKNRIMNAPPPAPPYYIGALVTSRGDQPTVDSLAIIPISDRGVWIESEYERDFYNHCHKLNRLIIKPYLAEEYPILDGMIPDGIFIDTYPHNTIAEVFGIALSDLDYHKKRLKKMKHFGELENFSFYKWDAFRQKIITPLPPRGATEERLYQQWKIGEEAKRVAAEKALAIKEKTAQDNKIRLIKETLRLEQAQKDKAERDRKKAEQKQLEKEEREHKIAEQDQLNKDRLKKELERLKQEQLERAMSDKEAQDEKEAKAKLEKERLIAEQKQLEIDTKRMDLEGELVSITKVINDNLYDIENLQTQINGKVRDRNDYNQLVVQMGKTQVALNETSRLNLYRTRDLKQNLLGMRAILGKSNLSQIIQSIEQLTGEIKRQNDTRIAVLRKRIEIENEIQKILM